MKYLHINIKGFPKGYYPEAKAWEMVKSVPQGSVKFLAGPFTHQDIQELRAKTKQEGRRPLPIYEN